MLIPEAGSAICWVVFPFFPSRLLRFTTDSLCNGPEWFAAYTDHRPCFTGLENADASDTKKWVSSLAVSDQALFRKLLNGSHVTQDGKAYCDDSASDLCPFCPCSDSRYHRFWECPHFDCFRSHICPVTLKCISELPESLTTSGWSLHPTTALEWNQYFAQLPAPSVPRVTFQGAVHLFTDGSCFAQHDVQLRFAAWAVIQASCDGVTDYTGSRILGSGPLPGLLQSSVRAEFFAIMIALQITADHDGCVFLWTDCEAVVKRWRRLISGSHVRVNSAHADLWHRIEEALDGRRHKVVITRVAAHQCPDEAPPFFAEWCFRHNGLADKQAVRANFQRGEEFWDLQRRHSQATASVEFFNRTVQRVLLRISQEVVRQEVTCLSELPGVPQEPSVPLQPWRQLPAVSIPAAATRWYGDSMVRLLASWFWHTLTDCAAPVVWVSHFQLYTDFMLSTGHPGPVHVGRWVDGKSVSWLSLRGFSFKQRTRWFIKVLKETLRHLDVKLQMDYGKPWSQMILFHTGIIALPWPAARLSLVDDWFLQCGTGCTYRRQSKALESLPFAPAHGSFPLVPLTTIGL